MRRVFTKGMQPKQRTVNQVLDAESGLAEPPPDEPVAVTFLTHLLTQRFRTLRLESSVRAEQKFGLL